MRFKTLLILLFCLSVLFAQNKTDKFYHLTMRDGLSNNDVTTIFKDSKGFLWVGTRDGLNKYNGYDFTVYRNNIGNPKSISGNDILSITEDHNGGLWIGTVTGVSKYNRETDTFTPENNSTNTSNEAFNNRAISLLVDYKNQLWIAFQNRIVILDPETGKRNEIACHKTIEKLLQGKPLIFLYEDKARNIWMGISGGGGLIKVTANRKNATLFDDHPAKQPIFPQSTICSIYEDENKLLWLGTLNDGLYTYNADKQQFAKVNSPIPTTRITSIVPAGNHQLWLCQGHSMSVINVQNPQWAFQYTNNPNDPQSFTPGYAVKLYKDNTGIIWIATGVGISYFDPNRDKFSLFYHNIGSENGVEKHFVKSCAFDEKNNAWIGTFKKGLFYYDKTTRTSTQYKASQTGLSTDMVTAICKVQSGEYWIGNLSGISIFDAKTKKVTSSLKHSDSEANSLYHNIINKIFQDKRGNMWIATLESLDLIRGGKFTHFSKGNLNGLSHYLVNDILEDREGSIWIATTYGLNKYDYSKNKFTQYLSNPNDKNSLSNSTITALSEDSKGTLWIATQNGLESYDKKNHTFKKFLVKDDISLKMIYQMIAEKNSNNLWLVTSNGLSKLNTKTAVVKNYDESDGLSINTEGIYTDSTGNLYIGGLHNGFYTFQPKTIKDNSIIPPVYISNLLLFNKSVAIEPENENAILQKHISQTKEITLAYDQSVIGFEIAALNFTLPEKNQYAYKLEGFDKDWVYANAKKRMITYTNLATGTYTLRVKGSNNDGVWNEKGATLTIIITPPFWRQNFAYLIYLLLLIGAIYLFWWYLSYQNHEKSKVALVQLQAEKAHEMDLMKLRFFTNISHEFRTPLTLIAGPLNTLMTEARKGILDKSRVLEQYALMQRNTARLMHLINQLLDLQKSETGTLKLNFSYGDVMGFMDGLYQQFVPLAEQKNIVYLFFRDGLDKLETSFDTDKLEKIITNLLSNAFKFATGKVELSVKVQDKNLIIEVEDDGIGIAPGNLTHIFEDFYQVDNSNTRKNEGSGIGLALTRELVKLHNGTITAQSEQGVRTVFRVNLPLSTVNGQRTTDSGQQTTVSSEQTIVNGQRTTDGIALTVDRRPLTVDLDTVDKGTVDKETILIVEDNADLRLYIRDILGDTYRMVDAKNGKVGLEMALELLPDLVVSDVMMPVMDGMEMCHSLKNDERTSHIPIVLLTALSADEMKLKGLKTGADDYVTKPFNADLLLARIENLIETRHRLQQKFQHALVVVSNKLEPKEMVTNVGDEKLLKKAMELVEQNIDNLDFGIQEFVEGMNISRRGVYAKIKAITGQSVSDFIKSIRLRRAAQLLLTKEFTVSEICYMVGFQSRTHFHENFKAQFAMTPTEFVQKKMSESEFTEF